MSPWRGIVQMKLLRVLAFASFLAGIALLAFGLIRTFTGDDSNAIRQTSPPIDLEATPTPAPSATPVTPTATGVPSPTPTATPTPDDGAVMRMIIPKLKVDAAMEDIGLVGDNQLDVPHDPLDVGWYHLYDKPGVVNPANTGWYDFGVYSAPGFRGNSLFAAHKNFFPSTVGPFNDLTNLVLGDEVDVVMETGAVYRYHVIKVKQYDANTIDMGSLIWPKDKPANVEWITLITCGGRFQPLQPNGLGEYLDRDVVVAERFE